MSTIGHRRLAIGLAVAVVLLLGLSAKLFLDFSMLSIRAEFARDQVELFSQMRDEALESGPEGAADCLRGVIRYYPSGTKQITGSRLDRIVEHVRAEAARAILAHLRAKTGDDLGKDPERWIERYAKK